MTEGRKSFARRLVQERTGRDVPDLLRELYVERRLTDREIAALLGVARSTVREWRAELGVDRSERRAVLPEATA